MSRSDSDAGKSLDASPDSAPEFIAPEPAERQREPFWLVAIGGMLVAGAALLFTSPPVISSGGGRSGRRRKPSPKVAHKPALVREADEPHREPWWLMAFTLVVIVGVGLLLIFYAHLPPFLHY